MYIQWYQLKFVQNAILFDGAHRIIEFQSGLFPRVIFSFFDQAINFHFVISLLKINIEQTWIHRWKAGKTCVMTVKESFLNSIPIGRNQTNKITSNCLIRFMFFYFAILLFYGLHLAFWLLLIDCDLAELLFVFVSIKDKAGVI